MRHTSPQLPLSAPWIAHAHAAELAAMSALLDEQPALSAGVQQDLEAGCPTNARTGRPGLSGEQTLRQVSDLTADVGDCFDLEDLPRVSGPHPVRTAGCTPPPAHHCGNAAALCLLAGPPAVTIPRRTLMVASYNRRLNLSR